METQNNFKLKILLFVVAAFLLAGCGSSNSYNDSGNSDLGSNTPSPSAEKAYCSTNVDSSDTKIHISAYRDAYGQYYTNKFRVKVIANPSWRATNWDMTMRLMAASASGTLTPGATQNMTFEAPTNNGYASVSPYSYPMVNVSDEIFGMARTLGVVDPSLEYANFTQTHTQNLLNVMHFVLNTADTQNAFQVLRIEFRNASTGVIERTVDALLPVFHADPNEYAKTHSATLQNLHPLKSYASGGYTQAQYKAFADQWCF